MRNSKLTNVKEKLQLLESLFGLVLLVGMKTFCADTSL